MCIETATKRPRPKRERLNTVAEKQVKLPTERVLVPDGSSSETSFIESKRFRRGKRRARIKRIQERHPSKQHNFWSADVLENQSNCWVATSFDKRKEQTKLSRIAVDSEHQW